MSVERRGIGVVGAYLTLLLGTMASAQAAPELAESLALGVGEQRVLSSKGVRSYSEGLPGVVDVRLTRDASQFVVVGLKPGHTTLLFIMVDGSERHYRIHVEDESAPRANADPQRAESNERDVEPRDNIRLDFYFVQLDETYNHQIGVGWPGALGGANVFTANAQLDLVGGSLQGASAVVAGQVLPRLDMAQANGWAKIRRKAAVITANRTQARFTGGGEVNIPIQGALTAEIAKVEFGSQIQVRPRYDRDSGRIELAIQAEVSELTGENGTGIPGRTTSTLKTLINLELGQSLVLAGLRSHSETHDRTGIPLLNQIPILGGLFGSNSVREQQSENLVFIVPTVVDAVSEEDRRRIRDAMHVFEEYEGDLSETQLLDAGDPPKERGLRDAR